MPVHRPHAEGQLRQTAGLSHQAGGHVAAAGPRVRGRQGQRSAMDACWEEDERYCCSCSKSLEFCKLASWGKYLKNSKQDVPFHLKAGQRLPFPSLRHKGHLPAELMTCFTTWRVPTRVLSLLVSSLGSRKASRRSGEQQAAGQALIRELFVTSCPLLPAGCLHLQDKLGPAAREAGRSGLRPSQALAVCSPETQAGST